MDLKKFKEEFRGRALDFAVSGHLVKVFSSKNAKQKDKEFEELYNKLADWVIAQFAGDKLNKIADHIELMAEESAGEDSTMDIGF